MRSLLRLAGLAAAAVSIVASHRPMTPLSRHLHREWKKLLPRAPTDELPIYDDTPSAQAPKHNVWAQLTNDENQAVWDLLHDPASGLNLTYWDDATQSDNYVFLMETVPQNKSSVLPYLEGTGPEPPKYCRVIIFEGGRPEPRSQEYSVGPIPVSSDTRIQPLDYLYNGGRGGAVPFNSRVFDDKRITASAPLIDGSMANISDITIGLFGRAYYGANDDATNLTVATGTPSSFESRTVMVLMFRHTGPSAYMQPIDFYFLFDASGTDSSKYHVVGYVTKERFFETAGALREAYQNGELTQEFPQQDDGSWVLMDRKPEMGTRDLDDRIAPMTLSLGGKRYRLDREQQYFEYLGWSFYYSYTATLGVLLYDIRFKGERIMYELSMQEATSQYGGYQPKAASTMYQDTHFTMGAQIGALLEGYDCPFGSTMLDMFAHELNSTIVRPNTVCVFERDPDVPLSRHRYEVMGDGDNMFDFDYLGVVKDSILTMRYVSTIGNYDYMFDYSFHVDGSISVDVRASGFLQASPLYADQTSRWGPRVQQGTQGSFHEHVLTFKADFDLIDTANSLQQTRVVVKNQSQPWFKNLGYFSQIELETSMVETETRTDYASNGQTMYCIVNENRKNEWDTVRGYRIIPGLNPVRLSIEDSPFSYRNTEFAKMHLAISQQHDTEPLANSFQNANAPYDPQQDFSKFFDGESIRGEDLVVWFNLGMHHFTRSEDVPVTLASEAHSSIMFSPQNFFDKSQDGDLMNRRWVTVTPNYTLEVDNYGVSLPNGQITIREPGLDLTEQYYL